MGLLVSDVIAEYQRDFEHGPFDPLRRRQQFLGPATDLVGFDRAVEVCLDAVQDLDIAGQFLFAVPGQPRLQLCLQGLPLRLCQVDVAIQVPGNQPVQPVVSEAHRARREQAHGKRD